VPRLRRCNQLTVGRCVGVSGHGCWGTTRYVSVERGGRGQAKVSASGSAARESGGRRTWRAWRLPSVLALPMRRRGSASGVQLDVALRGGLERNDERHPGVPGGPPRGAYFLVQGDGVGGGQRGSELLRAGTIGAIHHGHAAGVAIQRPSAARRAVGVVSLPVDEREAPQRPVCANGLEGPRAADASEEACHDVKRIAIGGSPRSASQRGVLKADGEVVLAAVAAAELQVSDAASFPHSGFLRRGNPVSANHDDVRQR
jgi:hypothetical protein